MAHQDPCPRTAETEAPEPSACQPCLIDRVAAMERAVIESHRALECQHDAASTMREQLQAVDSCLHASADQAARLVDAAGKTAPLAALVRRFAGPIRVPAADAIPKGCRDCSASGDRAGGPAKRVGEEMVGARQGGDRLDRVPAADAIPKGCPDCSASGLDRVPAGASGPAERTC